MYLIRIWREKADFLSNEISGYTVINHISNFPSFTTDVTVLEMETGNVIWKLWYALEISKKKLYLED